MWLKNVVQAMKPVIILCFFYLPIFLNRNGCGSVALIISGKLTSKRKELHNNLVKIYFE